MRRLRSQRGFSLLEIVIVLGVATLLVTGIWMIAATAMNNHKKSVLIRDVAMIIQDTRALFSAQPIDVGTFTQTDAINARLFPASWLRSSAGGGQLLVQPFARNFNVHSASMRNSANNIYLWIGDPAPGAGLPQDACVALATGLGTTANFERMGFLMILVFRGAGLDTRFYKADMPITVPEASQACASATDNTVQVIFDPT